MQQPLPALSGLVGSSSLELSPLVKTQDLVLFNFLERAGEGGGGVMGESLEVGLLISAKDKNGNMLTF